MTKEWDRRLQEIDRHRNDGQPPLIGTRLWVIQSLGLSDEWKRGIQRAFVDLKGPPPEIVTIKHVGMWPAQPISYQWEAGVDIARDTYDLLTYRIQPRPLAPTRYRSKYAESPEMRYARFRVEAIAEVNQIVPEETA